MSESNVVFCLLGRDVAHALPALAGFIEGRGALFYAYRVIFVENDSVDDTPVLLRQWASQNDRVRHRIEKMGLPRWPQVPSTERSEQLASLRNRYLDAIPELDMKPDFAVVMDADLDRGISPRGMTNSFGYEDWDVMSSNGIANDDEKGGAEFYDAWAFREGGQNETRSFSEINAQRFIPGMPPVPIWSGFGGMAIYRADCLQDARYGGSDCEHVVLHQQLHERGFSRHYLNPSQVTLYSN
ncbi:MAG: hypothetical protein AAGI11_04735 [Pseudomonadota bacterium]